MAMQKVIRHLGAVFWEAPRSRNLPLPPLPPPDEAFEQPESIKRKLSEMKKGKPFGGKTK